MWPTFHVSWFIQAILQASESDDDDYLDPNAKPISIEDILREDDELVDKKSSFSTKTIF